MELLPPGKSLGHLDGIIGDHRAACEYQNRIYAPEYFLKK